MLHVLWWGGFYERLIGSVKRALRKILFRATVTYNELLTILAEIEGIMNSRPLGYHYSDDIEEEITPSHLFSGRRLLTVYTNQNENENNQVNLSKRMMYMKRLIDNLWHRWSSKYLTSLREFETIGKSEKKIFEGDIVVVHNHQTKRNHWKLGKIIELITGSDNIPRAAVVKIRSGESMFNIKRPVTKLYPLEINENFEVTANEKQLPVITDKKVEDNAPVVRPTRMPANNGILIRRRTEQS